MGAMRARMDRILREGCKAGTGEGFSEGTGRSGGHRGPEAKKVGLRDSGSFS